MLLGVLRKLNTYVYHQGTVSKSTCGRKRAQTTTYTKENCRLIRNDKSSIKRRHKKGYAKQKERNRTRMAKHRIWCVIDSATHSGCCNFEFGSEISLRSRALCPPPPFDTAQCSNLTSTKSLELSSKVSKAPFAVTLSSAPQ